MPDYSRKIQHFARNVISVMKYTKILIDLLLGFQDSADSCFLQVLPFLVLRTSPMALRTFANSVSFMIIFQPFYLSQTFLAKCNTLFSILRRQYHKLVFILPY